MRWVSWSIGEALTKTSAKLIQKVVGSVSFLFSHMVLAALVISVVQVVVGYTGIRWRRASLLCGWRLVGGALLFGVVAFGMTVLAFSVFLPSFNGSVGISTFIITLAIFPSAVIDALVFKDRIGLRSFFGFLLGALAGYSVLGLPSLRELLAMPTWVWMSFGVMGLGVCNEWISRWIKEIHPMAKNFWGGLATLVCCLITLISLDSLDVLMPTRDFLKQIYLLSLVIGLLVVAMWSFKIASYKSGAGIALKSLVMNGTYLCTTMIAGMLIFDEAATVSKFVGIGLYIIAFTLANDPVWLYIRSFWQPVENDISTTSL